MANPRNKIWQSITAQHVAAVAVCFVVIITSILSIDAANRNNYTVKLSSEVPSGVSSSKEETSAESPFLSPVFDESREKLLEAQSINKDAMAWIYIPNTNVDFPIMKSKNSDYAYLKRNIYKKWDYYGSICAHYKSNFSWDHSGTNSVIYGHNMGYGNTKKFGHLEKFKKADFVAENQFIYVTTKDNNYIFKLFASSLVTAYAPFNEVELTPKEKETLIYEARRRSFVDIDTDVSVDDPILTLSTCTYEYGYPTNVRLVVIAKLISDSSEAELSNAVKNADMVYPSDVKKE